MRRVRKQLSITPEQQERVSALASCWHCSDAEVIRRAIDTLPDPESSIHAHYEPSRLVMYGDHGGEGLPTDEEIARLEAESDAWFASHPEAHGLGEAVLEDRC